LDAALNESISEVIPANTHDFAPIHDALFQRDRLLARRGSFYLLDADSWARVSIMLVDSHQPDAVPDILQEEDFSKETPAQNGWWWPSG
jgi:hypothetical protein